MKKLVIRMNKFILLLLPLSVWSQQNEVLTLEQAIQKGMEYSKQLKVSQAKMDGFKAKIAQTKNNLIPSISLNANYMRLSDNIVPTQVVFPGVGLFTLNPQILNQYANRASLQYPIFAGFRTKNGLESLNYLEKASQLDIEKDKAEVKYNIINAYLNVLRAQNSLSAVDSTIEQLEVKAVDIRSLQKNGMALQNDVLKADMAVSSAKVSREDVFNTLQIAMFNLNLMLGIPTEQKTILESGSLKNAVSLNGVETYLSDAAKQRTDLQAQFYRTQAQESTVKQSRAGYWPIFSLGANYYYNNPNARIFPMTDKFKDTWDAGATLSWNLSNLITTKAVTNDAKATLAQNQSTYEMLGDNIKLEVFSSYSTCKTSLQKIELNELAVKQANENLLVLNSKYKNNSALMSDVIEAEAQALQAKVNLLNARIDSQLAYYKLIKSTGK